MIVNPLTRLDFALTAFLTDGQARNLRPRTIDYYRQQVGWFLAYVADSGATAPQDITPHHVRGYLVHLQQEREWADASVHTAARAVRAFLRFLEAEGMIAESPMKRVRMPRNGQPVKNPFSVDELKRLVAAARTQRDRAMVLCLLDSGCRISEFASWRYGDLDLQSGAVHLASSSTKGRRARVVYLGGKARQELMKWVAGLPAINADTPLWQNEYNRQPLSPVSVREVIKRIGHAAKVSHAGHTASGIRSQSHSCGTAATFSAFSIYWAMPT